MVEKVRDGHAGYVVGASQHDDEQGLTFIPFEHTKFSSDNLQAMALLIMLFER